MQFTRLPILFLAFFLAIFAAASATNPTVTVTVTSNPTSTAVPPGDCSTGDQQCCNTVTKASNPAAGVILALLGILVQDLNVLVGINCSPITVIGGGAAGCNAHPVCCQNNNFHGLINIGCLPISL